MMPTRCDTLQRYSGYRSALVALNLRLKGLGACVQGLARMNQVKELGAPTGRHIVDTYYHLLKQTERHISRKTILM